MINKVSKPSRGIKARHKTTLKERRESFTESCLIFYRKSLGRQARMRVIKRQ